MTPWRRNPPDATVPSGSFEVDVIDCLDALYATALRLTRNRDAAEDLVQETYLKAFRFAPQFEPGTNVRAWLFTILYNTHRNVRRDSGRNPVEVDTDVVEQAPTPSAAETPEDQLLRGALSDDVRQALDALPAAFREAVWLRDVEDLSYAEISQVLNVPSGTVMSRIARGRRQLFERLRGQRESREGDDRSGAETQRFKE